MLVCMHVYVFIGVLCRGHRKGRRAGDPGHSGGAVRGIRGRRRGAAGSQRRPAQINHEEKCFDIGDYRVLERFLLIIVNYYIKIRR